MQLRSVRATRPVALSCLRPVPLAAGADRATADRTVVDRAGAERVVVVAGTVRRG
jgi:hypothetical protein